MLFQVLVSAEQLTASLRLTPLLFPWKLLLGVRNLVTIVPIGEMILVLPDVSSCPPFLGWSYLEHSCPFS